MDRHSAFLRKSFAVLVTCLSLAGSVASIAAFAQQQAERPMCTQAESRAGEPVQPYSE